MNRNRIFSNPYDIRRTWIPYPRNPRYPPAELIAKIIGMIKEIEVYMGEHGFSLKSLVEAEISQS